MGMSATTKVPMFALLTLLSCATSSRQGGAAPPNAVADPMSVADHDAVAAKPTPTDAAASKDAVTNAVDGSVATEPAPLPDDYLQFSAACTPGERVSVGAVGDVLLHRELARHGAEDRRRFRAIWADVADLLGAPDITYANLEGPLAPGLDRDGNEVADPGLAYDGVVYSGYPRFNYHPSLAVDLRRDGVDVVSTANNHALDRGGAGVDRTIASLRKAGLAYTGTRPSDRLDAPWHVVTNVGPLRVAWLACTRHTNQRPDDKHQVLRCDRDRRDMTRQIERLVGRDGIDAVIVLPHFGKQYVAKPSARDVEWVHDWLDAGAIAVIGNHPHVVRPWEKYLARDGRETFAIYSLGNFVSHQPELPRRSTAVLYLGLVRGEDGVTRIDGVRYVPVHVEREEDRYFARPVGADTGPSEVRRHLVSMLGAPNLLEPAEVQPGEPLPLTPHCAEGWVPENTPPELRRDEIDASLVDDDDDDDDDPG